MKRIEVLKAKEHNLWTGMYAYYVYLNFKILRKTLFAVFKNLFLYTIISLTQTFYSIVVFKNKIEMNYLIISHEHTYKRKFVKIPMDTVLIKDTMG